MLCSVWPEPSSSPSRTFMGPRALASGKMATGAFRKGWNWDCNVSSTREKNTSLVSKTLYCRVSQQVLDGWLLVKFSKLLKIRILKKCGKIRQNEVRSALLECKQTLTIFLHFGKFRDCCPKLVETSGRSNE